jgi:hypothetical protein
VVEPRGSGVRAGRSGIVKGFRTPGLERSLSVTGNFGAASGSGTLMKGSRLAADSMLEGSEFEPPVPDAAV